MATQTIEVEGLPEGWKAVDFRWPKKDVDHVFDGIGVKLFLGKEDHAMLIVGKIQSRRIVLDQIQMSEAKLGDFMRHPGDIRTIINVGAERHDETYTFYREVKETNEDPHLKFTKKDILELIEHIKLGGQLNHKIAEFINYEQPEPKLSLSVIELKDIASNAKYIMDKIAAFIKDK